MEPFELINVITNVYTKLKIGDNDMHVPIKKIGNSKGVVIPASVLKMLGMNEHDAFILSVKDDVVTLKKKPEFNPQSLRELFQNVDALQQKNDIVFDDHQGREVW